MSLPVCWELQVSCRFPLGNLVGLLLCCSYTLFCKCSRQFCCFTIAWGGLGFAFVTDLVRICFMRSSCAKVVRFLIEPLIIFALI